MKANAIVRIIIFSAAILILLSILGVGLGVHTYMFRSSESHTEEATHIPQKIGSGDGSDSITLEPTKVRNIEINWVSGILTIEPSADVTDIVVFETAVDDKDQRMVCKHNGSTLTIDYCKDDIKFPSFGISTSISKDLTILVPQGWSCDSLEIDTASADVWIRDLTVDEFDFDGASGNCDLENCVVGSVDVDAASGDLFFCGSLDSLDFDGASSNCSLVLSNCPKSIQLDGMSGDLSVTLPADCGFRVDINGMSTDFFSEFETTSHNGGHVHGNGSCRISVDAMSGSVNILKGSENCHDNHH